MSFFRTVVGIDPSGKRIALAAVRFGIGRPLSVAPPAVFELHAEKEQARREEAEKVLADFVARNGLAGADAKVLLPAERVFVARVSLPPLREKDLRPAIALELERIFPFPASRLAFGWRRLPDGAGGGNVRYVVVAAPAEEIARWEETASRAGLVLAGAVPSAWALAAGCRSAGIPIGKEGEIGAVLRQTDGSVECAVLDGVEPFFSAVRPCSAETAPAEGFSLLADALVDVSPSRAEAGVGVVAPAGWMEKGAGMGFAAAPLRPVPGFEAGGALPETFPAWGLLGAYGAASSEKEVDLLAPERGRGIREAANTVTAALVAVVVLLGLSWPAAALLRAKQDLSRLDMEIAALRPAVARVEDSMSLLSDIEERAEVLREASVGREGPLLVLRELTERLPQGVWLTGLRVEGRKVELDGLAPSASEIFPLLSRDGKFAMVEFASPITRQPDNLERFQIRAEFGESPLRNPEEGEAKP